MKFHKVLAKYYNGWAKDCGDSAEFCKARGEYTKAQKYLEDKIAYEMLIEQNKEAIEFFSTGDNAFKLDGALPEKFRGYK